MCTSVCARLQTSAKPSKPSEKNSNQQASNLCLLYTWTQVLWLSVAVKTLYAVITLHAPALHRWFLASVTMAKRTFSNRAITGLVCESGGKCTHCFVPFMRPCLKKLKVCLHISIHYSCGSVVKQTQHDFLSIHSQSIYEGICWIGISTIYTASLVNIRFYMQASQYKEQGLLSANRRNAL